MALAVNRNVPPSKATSRQVAYSNTMDNMTSSIPVNLRLPLDYCPWQKVDSFAAQHPPVKGRRYFSYHPFHHPTLSWFRPHPHRGGRGVFLTTPAGMVPAGTHGGEFTSPMAALSRLYRA